MRERPAAAFSNSKINTLTFDMFPSVKHEFGTGMVTIWWRFDEATSEARQFVHEALAFWDSVMLPNIPPQ